MLSFSHAALADEWDTFYDKYNGKVFVVSWQKKRNPDGTTIGCKCVSLEAKSAYHLLVDEYKEANKSDGNIVRSGLILLSNLARILGKLIDL